MNREIKFRAWGEDLQMMMPVVDLSSPLQEFKWLGRVDLPIMQYTGFKDKNGVEIYDGDIVGTFKDEDNEDYDGKPSKWILVVRFDEDDGKWIIMEEEVITTLESIYENQVSDISLRDKDEIEVIGNIYQSKDLLI